MMSIWITCFVDGDLHRLLGTTAWDGTVCGVDTPDKIGFIPHLGTTDFWMCASSCEFTANMTKTMKYPADIFAYIQLFPPHGTNWPVFDYESTEIYGMCKPDMIEDDDEPPTDEEIRFILNVYISDMFSGLWVIGVSAAIGLIMSFIYLKFVEKCAGCLIWSTLAITLICGAAVGYFLLMDGIPKGEAAGLQVLVGYGFLGATILWFLILVFLRNRIRVAVQVIKSATRAITDMKTMLLVPLPLALVGLGFAIAWIFSMLFIRSVGKFTDLPTPAVLNGVTINSVLISETYKIFTYDKDMNNTIWANLFFMFWVLNFIIYLLYLIIAGAVADWYFTRRDEKGNKIRGTKVDELSKSPLCSAFCRTIRYHLGTIAFASLIIAVIQTIRVFVAYLEKTAGEKKTKIQKLMFKLIHCILWCAEKCLDKISKNALIFTAIYGQALCPAAFASFKLIWRNLARTAAISLVSGFIGMLGKLCIVLFTCAIGVIILSEATEVNFMFMPILMIFFISYMVAALFMNLLGIVVDVVFLCFLVDEEANKEKGQMFADDGLKTIVQSNEKASKAIADRSKSNRTQVAPVDV